MCPLFLSIVFLLNHPFYIIIVKCLGVQRIDFHIVSNKNLTLFQKRTAPSTLVRFFFTIRTIVAIFTDHFTAPFRIIDENTSYYYICSKGCANRFSYYLLIKLQYVEMDWALSVVLFGGFSCVICPNIRVIWHNRQKSMQR